MQSPPAKPKSRPNDVFPATQLAWIDAQLDMGQQGRTEINRHIMSVYRFPLHVYFLGTRDRWIGEPEEVINGFFADRLARPNFLADWRVSGLRLRHWLINAFCFYLRELRRLRHRGKADSPKADEPVEFAGDTREIDRAYVSSLVREALIDAEKACVSQGFAMHWQVFSMHFCLGKPYEQFVEELGIDAGRAVVMARTAKKKFQAALRSLVARDSTGDDDINAEIRGLMEGS